MAWAAQGTVLAKALDRERWARAADALAVALAVSLPWSTSATAILAVLWLLAVAPTLDAASLRRELATPVGGPPVLLWALGLIGMLWADVPLSERIDGLSSYYKLLFIPLLMVHFRRSTRGSWVIIGFLASCTILLVLSWALALLPGLSWRGKFYPSGIPVKNYASQADLFTICIFVLAAFAVVAWRHGRRRMAVASAGLALLFFANILQVATSRTALVVIAVLVLVFGFRWFGWKGMVGLLALVLVCGAVAWTTSSFLRLRLTSFVTELQQYQTENVRTSAGERVEFWKKSLRFIAQAPLVGHGTGSIRDQFRRAGTGESGASSLASTNPHNQTFAIAIQLGLVGTTALFAMWIAQLLFFRAEGLAAWVGLVVVIQNIVGSLFNSLLFDFTQGWMYVVGVGIAGGALLKTRDPAAAP
jgi:O-antigen ligase